MTESKFISPKSVTLIMFEVVLHQNWPFVVTFAIKLFLCPSFHSLFIFIFFIIIS